MKKRVSMPAKTASVHGPSSQQVKNPNRKSTSSVTQTKKTVLHNVEVPLSSNKRVTFHSTNQQQSDSRNLNGHNGNSAACVNLAKNVEPSKKYHKPQLNTTLKISKEIKDLNAGKKNGEVEKKVMKEILQETDSLRKEQLTKQLNFPKQKKVFTGLIPININDSVIQMDAKKIVPRKPDFTKTDRDPEPSLSDFVEPVPPFEFEDLRSTIKFGPERFKPPDLASMSEQIQQLHELTQIDY